MGLEIVLVVELSKFIKRWSRVQKPQSTVSTFENLPAILFHERLSSPGTAKDACFWCPIHVLDQSLLTALIQVPSGHPATMKSPLAPLREREVGKSS
jgi:hypothetical protein